MFLITDGVETVTTSTAASAPPPERSFASTQAAIRYSLKFDYAVRAMLELAARDPATAKIQDLVREQNLPTEYIHAVLARLVRQGLVISRRGPRGGYALAQPPHVITLADIADSMNEFVIEAPLRGFTTATGAAAHLPAVWQLVGESVRAVLEGVTLTDILGGSHARKSQPR